MSDKKVKEPKVEKKESPEGHHKPTNEELDKGMEESLKEVKEIEEKETDKDGEEIIQVPDEEEETPKPSPDYKERFINSSKEAIVLHEKNKVTNKAIDEALETPEPTEDELKVKYDDWDVMSDFEKKMAKESEWNTQKFAKLEDSRKISKNIEQWIDKVDKFIDDPENFVKHPELEGKQDDFKLFASKATRRGIEFETLVSAFLHDASKSAPAKKKGSMFDPGSAGTPTKTQKKSNKLTLEQGRRLMDSDYNKYREYLVSGKIETGAE